MATARGITRSDWLNGLLLGALTGFVMLGIGGRIVMRGIAVHIGQNPAFTLGGSLAVVAAGVACGAGAGICFVAARRITRNRIVSTLLFWTICVLVTLRGLRPLDTVKLVAFLPLVVLFGTVLHVLWTRVSNARRARAPPLQPANNTAES
jgi:hypothetical protein